MRPARLALVPLAAALLPAVTIHLCYLLAAAAGHVPWCVPYWDGCTSISATGRQGPEAYVFRALMIPTAVLFAGFWLLARAWLAELGSPHAGRRTVMLACGLVGAVGLVLYTTVLGAEGRVFFFQRRAGVISFYILTVLAQGLLTLEVLAAARRGATGIARGVQVALAALSGTVVASGLVSLALSTFVPAYDRIEHAVEWSLTALVLAHAFVTHLAWRQSGFALEFRTGRG